MPTCILTHGGARSALQNVGGTLAAARHGLDLIANGKFPLAGVVQAMKYLEDDPRFKAGIGSQIRSDDSIIQMDVACMMSKGPER